MWRRGCNYRTVAGWPEDRRAVSSTLVHQQSTNPSIPLPSRVAFCSHLDDIEPDAHSTRGPQPRRSRPTRASPPPPSTHLHLNPQSSIFHRSPNHNVHRRRDARRRAQAPPRDGRLGPVSNPRVSSPRHLSLCSSTSPPPFSSSPSLLRPSAPPSTVLALAPPPHPLPTPSWLRAIRTLMSLAHRSHQHRAPPPPAPRGERVRRRPQGPREGEGAQGGRAESRAARGRGYAGG